MFMNYDFHFHCLPISFVANSIPRRAALSSQKSFFVERPAVLHLSIEKTRKPKPTLLTNDELVDIWIWRKFCCGKIRLITRSSKAGIRIWE